MWQVVFWVSLALLIYIYIGYPALLAALARASRRREPAPGGGETPSVCLIISAFDEEKVIRQKIENSLSLDYPRRLAIVVASDGSTDATVSIAEEYRDRGVEVHHSDRRQGKNAVLNDVVRLRTEDIVVFTDANSVLGRDAIIRLVDHLRDPSIGCAVGELVYSNDLSSAGQGESLYWRYEARIKMYESRLRSVLVANGSIFSVRRRLFRDLYSDVANDLQVPFDVASQGYGIVYEPRALAIERSADLWEEEFGRKVRIVLRGITGFRRLRGRVRGIRLWQFVSHKLLRWCVGAVLLVLLAANAALVPRSPFYAGFMVLQVLCYAAACLGWMMRSRPDVPRVLYVPFYFTMVNYAALVAMVRFLAGRRQVVWEKAESTRSAVPPLDAMRPGHEKVRPIATPVGSAETRRVIEK